MPRCVEINFLACRGTEADLTRPRYVEGHVHPVTADFDSLSRTHDTINSQTHSFHLPSSLTTSLQISRGVIVSLSQTKALSVEFDSTFRAVFASSLYGCGGEYPNTQKMLSCCKQQTLNRPQQHSQKSVVATTHRPNRAFPAHIGTHQRRLPSTLRPSSPLGSPVRKGSLDRGPGRRWRSGWCSGEGWEVRRAR